jgi:hypothetical protein
MVIVKNKDSLVKMDSELLGIIKEVVKDNRLTYPSIKFFIQKAVLKQLENFRGKENLLGKGGSN